jgi:hypothetical protein
MYDNTHSQNISYGECDKAGFTTGEFAGWFAEEYELYMVNDKVFDRSYEIKFDSIYVFLGTWCDDSHREVPRFVKIMEHEYFAGVPVSYFCLDGNKTTDIIEVEEYYLQFVPTFVFYYRGEELCRIVELPKDSLEEDIMDLLGRIQP